MDNLLQKKRKTTEKSESFLSTTHIPLFLLGICSVFSIFLLIFSFFAKENKCHCDEICGSKDYEEKIRCCCGACACCSCYYCCRRCCRGGSYGSTGGHNYSSSDCNCGGADEGVGYAILIAIVLFIFILMKVPEKVSNYFGSISPKEAYHRSSLRKAVTSSYNREILRRTTTTRINIDKANYEAEIIWENEKSIKCRMLTKSCKMYCRMLNCNFKGNFVNFNKGFLTKLKIKIINLIKGNKNV